jgi:glycosyltransferase involved in cell wall biosynthesis
LLPSYFPGESLPSAVMEYLACGIPVITTNVGEIKNMLKTPDGLTAGSIVELNSYCKPSATDLANAMMTYVDNPCQLAHKSKLAKSAFRKFDIRHCSSHYETFFEQIRENAMLMNS